jgi:hypothetical protein
MTNSDEDDESWIPGFKSGNLVCVRQCCGSRSELEPSSNGVVVPVPTGRKWPPKIRKYSCFEEQKLYEIGSQSKTGKISENFLFDIRKQKND